MTGAWVVVLEPEDRKHEVEAAEPRVVAVEGQDRTIVVPVISRTITLDTGVDRRVVLQ